MTATPPEPLSPQLLLASASPRRRELLSFGNLAFRVVASPFDEATMPFAADRPPAAWVEALSLAKAKAVLAGAESIVLGADTAVVREGRVFGKPRDEAEALAFLKALNDGWHEVITGIALIGQGRELVRHAVTRVHMRYMTDTMLRAYVATGEPADKAGAYAIQGGGSIVVDRIEGCYTNVVGLSLPLLDEMLTTGFGLSLLGVGHGGAAVPVPHSDSSLTGS